VRGRLHQAAHGPRHHLDARAERGRIARLPAAARHARHRLAQLLGRGDDLRQAVGVGGGGGVGALEWLGRLADHQELAAIGLKRLNAL